jgi:hypothetical protein
MAKFSALQYYAMLDFSITIGEAKQALTDFMISTARKGRGPKTDSRFYSLTRDF